MENKTWELTEEEWQQLDDKQKVIYRDAKLCMSSEEAGGYFGWSRGMELLKGMGWAERKRKEGHRVFVSLEKPTSLIK